MSITFRSVDAIVLGQYALSGVDIALWDLAGKIQGLSVAALLGGGSAPLSTLCGRGPGNVTMHHVMSDPEMVIVRTLAPDHRPSWSDVTSAGTFRVEPGGRFDRHFHDCDEYWLVFGGRARVMVGPTAYEVEPGDIVCTPTGTEHDVVGVYETLEAFWFEGHTPAGGRIGHLHRTDEDAQGHEVPALEA